MKREKVTAVASVLAFFLVVCLLTSVVLFPSNSVSARTGQGEIDKQEVIENLGNMPVYFEENQGQFHRKARYLARGTNGFSLFLTATDAVYVLSEKQQGEKGRSGESEIDELRDPGSKIQSPRSTAVYMSLVGGNDEAADEGFSQLEHRTNYFKGSRENWRTEIPNYQSVRFDGVYPGIDMVWHGRGNGGAQYDFIVEPRSNPEQIAWEVKGADSVELDEEGDLLIKTEYGDIKQNKPFTYQEENGLRQEVESNFVLETTESAIGDPQSAIVRFALGSYNPTKPLVIDPSVGLSTLLYSTFLGGSNFDIGSALDVDNVGNVYVTGSTASTTFPTTPGTFDPTHNGGGTNDVFVTKLNATGSALLYSTFIGAAGSDSGFGIAVDPSGNAFITGETQSGFSPAYPTTAGAFDETQNGSTDVFVTKLNADGSALVYSTLIGGNLSEAGNGIAIDSSGNAFITGRTRGGASPYPTTVAASDTTHNGGEDVFVTKLNSIGSALLYSTFIGGSENDVSQGIAIDLSGNAFITGYTAGGTTAYPTTAGVFDTSHNGSTDVFVTKLNTAGSALFYSTFIGGNASDIGYGIAIDSSGDAYITGLTAGGSPAYPTTVGAFDTTHNSSFDAFVTKLNATGSALIYSTFIGGSSDDEGRGIATDPSGNAFITGFTGPGYPTTAGAFDTTYNGGGDIFVTTLDASGSTLVYSTYIGGDGGEISFGIAIDSSGNAFVTGYTGGGSPASYPTTAGAFDTTFGGSSDVFVTKLEAGAGVVPLGFEADVAPRQEGDGVVLSTDLTQIRRFVTGLDTAVLIPNEFQRADCGPRTTFGDGAITASDVVQARRYVTGLDPQTAAAGPTGPATVPAEVLEFIDDVHAYFSGRKITIGSPEPVNGATINVPVEMELKGFEAAVSFVLTYDAARFSNPRIELGDAVGDDAVLTVNAYDKGRIAVLVDSGTAWAAAERAKSVVVVTFDVVGDEVVPFGGSISEISVSDAFGNPLAVKWIGGN